MNRAHQHIRFAALAVLLLGAGFAGAQIYNTLNYTENGGARTVIGGSLDVVSGGDLDIESGASLKMAGTTVAPTATELNSQSLSSNGAVVRTKVISITSTPTGSEQSTGWQLPVNAIVLDVSLLTTTAEATAADKRFHVGLLAAETGGDTDGFMVGVNVATTGITTTTDTARTVAAGTSATEDYLMSTTRGALLGVFTAGADAAGDVGTSVQTPYVALSTKARTVVYDVEGADWANWRGKIIITYLEVAN